MGPAPESLSPVAYFRNVGQPDPALSFGKVGTEVGRNRHIQVADRDRNLWDGINETMLKHTMHSEATSDSVSEEWKVV
jgi:hypothetical protein